MNAFNFAYGMLLILFQGYCCYYRPLIPLSSCVVFLYSPDEHCALNMTVNEHEFVLQYLSLATFADKHKSHTKRNVHS